MAHPFRLPMPTNDASRLLEQYKVHKQVYMGDVSAVFKAVDLCTGAHVALKVYKKRRMDQTVTEQLEREMSIHSSLSHENIVDLITVFEDGHAVYLVQSYAQGGDLFSVLREGLGAVGRFDEIRTASTVIVPLLSALDYIHAKGIIHRDIKVENILFDADGTLKLADFGLAIDSNTARPGTRLGTWEYMAPEIHLCPFKGGTSQAHAAPANTTYSSSVDVWAVGVLTYELMVGRAPFQLHGTEMSYEDVMTEDLVFPDELSPDACSFIRSALCKQGRRRPTVGQLLKHRWLRPFIKVDLLDSAPAMGSVPQARAGRAKEQLIRDSDLSIFPGSPSPPGSPSSLSDAKCVSHTQTASTNLLASTPRQAAPPAAGSPRYPLADRRLLFKGMSTSDLSLRHSLRPIQQACAPPGSKTAGQGGREEPPPQGMGDRHSAAAAACEGGMESRKLRRPSAAYDAADFSMLGRAGSVEGAKVKAHLLKHSSSMEEGSPWEGSGVTGSSSAGDGTRPARQAAGKPSASSDPSAATVEGLLQLPAVKGAPERAPRLPLLPQHVLGRSSSCSDMKSRVAASLEQRPDGTGSNGDGSRPRPGRADREAGGELGQSAYAASRQSRLSRLATNGMELFKRIAAD